MPKLRFLFVLVISFVMSIILLESLSVLSLCMFKTVRSLNRSWFILEWKACFSLRAIEKDFSLVTGFTKVSLHHRPLEKRERTGKEYGCFPFVWKTKIFK